MVIAKKKLLGQIIVGFLTLLFYFNGAQGQEFGVDRPGHNLKPGFDLPKAEYELCKKACDADPNCLAYTYVKPGCQGPSARCWLKNGIAPWVKNECCISGVKKQVSSLTTTPAGCIDWQRPPAGIVFALKHSSNQRDKRFVWGGIEYDPAIPQAPPAMFTRQDGGDLDGGRGEGFYWYETNGSGFQFPSIPPSDPEKLAWSSFQWKFPAGVVFGLKHSANQSGKFLVWLPDSHDFSAWELPRVYDPVNETLVVPYVFDRQNGGDRGGPAGTGFYWYEVRPRESDCDLSLPGGLVIGLKHSLNQQGKKLTWRGVEYDAAQRGGPVPRGFTRCHGGDLGAPSNQGYYWFETTGEGSTFQNRLGLSCGL